MASGIPGIPLALMAVGGVLVWSGVQNTTITSILHSLASGKKPLKGPAQQFATTGQQNTGTVTDKPPPPGDVGAQGASAATNQRIGRLLAAPFGWSTGTEWADLVSLWNRESGWNNLAENPSSGAFGIAQALGHGTSTSAGTHGNQYPSRAANDGSASAQITWGLGYIKDTYGSASNAWAHEEADGWY